MTPSIVPNKKTLTKNQETGAFNWHKLIEPCAKRQISSNPVQASTRFVNCFISHESLYGDSEGAKEMIKVLLLLQSVDSPVSASQLAQTQKSYEYLCAYSDILNETDAPLDLCLEFSQLIHVMETLLKIRTQAANGMMCSYGYLNSCLKMSA